MIREPQKSQGFWGFVVLGDSDFVVRHIVILSFGLKIEINILLACDPGMHQL